MSAKYAGLGAFRDQSHLTENANYCAVDRRVNGAGCTVGIYIPRIALSIIKALCDLP